MEIDIKFAWVPPGTFLMGSNTADDEKPIHRVTLTKGFYMGVVPVTQAQWQTVMGYSPSKFAGADRPVEMVSWDDCQDFCQRLGALTGKPIRLPTEAEWEYACRAGTNSDSSSGNDEAALKKVAWYAGNSGKQTHPVGKLAPNAWGLFDMHGNVWEWCQDWFAAYPKENVTDYLASRYLVMRAQYRVLRGGSWNLDAESCRAAGRGRGGPCDRYDYFGCRVVFCPD